MTEPVGESVWEADDTEPVADTTVGSILRDAARRSPDTTALVAGCADPSARRRWTYAELLADAERASLALAARFEPAERVAVLATSIPESLILTYAAALAGLVLVPVNPALRSTELRHVLGQSACVGAFVVPDHRGHDLMATVTELGADLPALREIVSFDDWEAFCSSLPDLASTGGQPSDDQPSSGQPTSDQPSSDQPSSDQPTDDQPTGDEEPIPADALAHIAALTVRSVTPDDVAQLVYTSGTTGSPKGALLTHRGMTNAARVGAVRFGMEPGDVYVQTMPLFHVGGQVVSFQLCQLSATAVLVPAFEPGLVLELIETERATLTCGVPTMLLALVDHDDFSRRDLSSLRSVSGGGAVVPAELVAHIEDALGVHFTVVFGQTEASGFISQTHLDDAAEDKGATLGIPLPGVSARVVDPDTRAVVEQGEVGELEVRGPNVMAGYHDLPDETAAAIGPGGWLRTGDLVTMDDRGYLRMTGRLKEMIVSGGENIFPVEIENALLEHPGVAQVAVVGVPDARWGESAVGVVVPPAGAAGAAGAADAAADAAASAVDPDELEAFLRDRMAAFKVPRRWVFVDELPRTASGKVQKHLIREQLETGR
jgi:fatty-acyl-CoA synthase